jgi:hypothetical protein
VFNPHADRAVLKRFRESEFSNISNMMEGKDVTIPKHSNKDVCLVWALKGECSAGCKRKSQHVRTTHKVRSPRDSRLSLKSARG